MAYQFSNPKGKAASASGPTTAVKGSAPKTGFLRNIITLVVVIIIIGGGIYLISSSIFKYKIYEKDNIDMHNTYSCSILS